MIVIKIENLSVGMEIKNYIELCKVLDVKETSGGARANQLEWFGDYFSYDKKGHRFIITDIYDIEVEPMKDGRGGSHDPLTHIENIEKLIVDILAQDNSNGKLFLSKSQLFKELEMVNENYSACKGRIPKLSKFMEIDEWNVQEWYDSTNGLLERSLHRALKNLESQSLVSWSRVITVCPVKIIGEPVIRRETVTNSYGEKIHKYVPYAATSMQPHREATDDEVRRILEVERDAMMELNCKNKQEVIRSGSWHKFENKVDDILLNTEGIAFYYKSYKVIFNKKHIREKSKTLNNLTLNREERAFQKTDLNRQIEDRTNRNLVNRQQKALNSPCVLFGNPTDIKIVKRVEDGYLIDGRKLSYTLINNNHKDIRDDVRKQKS